MAITLQQLSDEIGSDYLVDILQVFKFQAKDSYEDGDRELTEIRKFRAHMKAIGSKSVVNAAATYGQQQSETKKHKKVGKAPSGAIAKSAANQEEQKSALVSNKNAAALANAKVKAAEGKQLAQQGAMVMAEAYLTESANCYDQFTQSVIGSQEKLLGIADEACTEFDVSAFLEESGEDFLLEGTGDRLALPGAFTL